MRDKGIGKALFRDKGKALIRDKGLGKLFNQG